MPSSAKKKTTTKSAGNNKRTPGKGAAAKGGGAPNTTKTKAPAKRANKVAPSELAQQGEHDSRAARGRLPTGSLHAQARVPERADELKAKLTALINALNQLKPLGKSLPQNFVRIAEILAEVRDRALYEVRGYSSLEMFLERETDLSPSACLAALRIRETFLPEAIEANGFDRLVAALDAIDSAGPLPEEAPRPATGRSPIPPHKL